MTTYHDTADLLGGTTVADTLNERKTQAKSWPDQPARRPGARAIVWADARQRVGRPDLHLHDLRQAGSTWAAATGSHDEGVDGADGSHQPRRRSPLPACHRGP